MTIVAPRPVLAHDADGGRWYSVNGRRLPSVTSILKALPVGGALLNWKKRHAHDGDAIRDEAAARGTAVHRMVDRLVRGETLDDFDPYAGLLMDWWARAKPRVLLHEHAVANEAEGYAGTLDLLAEIDAGFGERVVALVDFKTSRTVAARDKWEAQLAAYQRAVDGGEGLMLGVLRLYEKDARPDFLFPVDATAGWKLFQEAMGRFWSFAP